MFGAAKLVLGVMYCCYSLSLCSSFFYSLVCSFSVASLLLAHAFVIALAFIVKIHTCKFTAVVLSVTSLT